MTITIKEKVPFSWTDEAFIQNPYPFYEELRSIHPIYKGSWFKYPGWFVTGYEEAMTILKDTRFQNRMPLPQTFKKYEQLKNTQNGMMLFKNDKEHKQLRFPVSREFTVRMVQSLRSYIQETTNDLLQQLKNQQSMDVVMDFAFPLASAVIAKIIGVPEEDREQFRRWSLTLIPTIDFTRSRRELNVGNETIMELQQYFKTLVEKRRQSPQEDLISGLMKAQQEGKLTEEELISTCILLIIAGHETTVNLISNSILILLQNPEQMLELKENPLLIENAVEEFLRFESPTQMIARTASEDIKIGETTIPKGDQVYILLGAANRDPQQFSNAHLLDMTRNPNPHITFGYGSHFCLGATLSRLEGQIAIQTFLQQINNPQLVDSEPKWRKLIGFRSLQELHITFD